MAKLISFFPVIVAGLLVVLGILASLVPVAVKLARHVLTEKQLRFAYDFAKAGAEALDLVDDKTETKLDDALKDLLESLREHLEREITAGEVASVTKGLLKAHAKANGIGSAARLAAGKLGAIASRRGDA